MSKKHKKMKFDNAAMFSGMGEEFDELLRTVPLEIVLNRMTTYGLRTLGKAMTDIMPAANGMVSEEKLALWAIHTFILVFQNEEAQRAIADILGEAMSISSLSELTEKMLP